MSKDSKSYVSLEARNIRYLFIVDSRISIDELLELFYQNQKHWGGRYNPILPCYGGKVSEEYLKLGALFDPDYVYYCEGIDLSEIKKYFTPIEFIEMPSISSFQLEGIGTSFLLNEISNSAVLISDYLYKSAPSLYSFYKLNFDFFESDDVEIPERCTPIYLDNNENQDKLLDTFMYLGIKHTSMLSRLNLKRPILNSEFNQKERIELIVSDDSNQFEDLIYYWNRQLFYEYGSNGLYQIHITSSQVDEFLKSNPKSHFFAFLGGRQKMKMCSFSLKESELNEIRDKLNRWQTPIQFVTVEPPKFPYRWDSYSTTRRGYDEPLKRQSLIGRKDLVHLPDLTFANRTSLYGEWVVDISIERVRTSENQQILLPQNTDFKSLFYATDGKDNKGRINKQSGISLLVGVDDRHIEFKISSDERILKSLIYRRHITPQSNISLLKVSDDGMKINSLFKLFKFNYELIEKYFEDKFWLSMFRSKSIMKGDGRMQQCKGTVSYLDLLSEYKNVFREEGYQNEEDINCVIELDNELKENLKELVHLGAYFIGNKVKCDNCSSALWYSLAELSNSIPCKGCTNKVTVPIESMVYYKVNDVVKNNLNSNSGTVSNLHGNLTVIYTILSLKRKSKDNFYFLPPQNFYVDSSPTHRSDIDIICVSDGKLIIGEAKNNVSEFATKEANNLIFLGNQIQPNEIILAFNEGEESKLATCLEKIKKGLLNKDIKVSVYKISQPYYKSRNLKKLEKLTASKENKDVTNE